MAICTIFVKSFPIRGEQKTVGWNDEGNHEDGLQEEFDPLCRLQLVEDENEELEIKEKLRSIQKMGRDPKRR